ncbi:NAD(P)H-binding protein [Actinosynnema sp. NPDC047251]|uniref:NmrA family protein n=1 Tax=Saccharothrix espanaensis (strain ATCC 51144 / DSM 44229 / JCM 9112 / NBRC 15066 / NRRL 15764) TaxID=1179773 RepID=K0KBK8_SACES|nr:NAD(P)H-binding protein [Saccharothrix espanaensis]CCH34932.1 NmrA family protein [Saccharothrix espanaensis DSM 44229]
MTILVTGATGNVGRRVVDRLVTEGAAFRALTRNPDKAGLPAGVETVKGDLTRPAELPLAGVTAVFLLAVLESDDAAGLAREFLASAPDLRRVVFLSSDAVTARRPGSYELHLSVEQVIEAAGVEWTHLRPGEFMANKLMWAGSIREQDVVRWAYPDAPGAPVHEADIAEVAVRALLDDGHAGRAYSLTGPDLLTHRQQAAAIGEGLGRPIAFEPLTYGQARASLIRDVGLPWDVAEYVLGYAAQHNEEPPPVSPDFERVVGRRGRTLAEWARDHAAELSTVNRTAG